ncbi:Cupredoxin [Glarea lozoyensis ATCC 20868]|uniref:Cupredoxin n=1 Tax=Glarea lozoyensis (strain ATCC 20868 / MF5171) TaxID=1116229 RepID=S3CQV5_GLAL2|nr:Cupredoxin [Glarea lozoyensis ATCC 20868]EPE28807.1 Cupredoxin [Glarea lozoyensis ATCC 20868]
MLYTTASILAFAAAASAVTIPVQVGVVSPDKPNIFSPEDITAEVGDIIEFKFNPKNHTVTQSSFAAPCKPISGGFFSEFVPVPVGQTSSTTFQITVTSRDPIWFYCSQTTGKHCQNGMVGAINAPKEGAKTLALYKEGAAALKNQNLTDTAPTTGKSQSIALPPPAAGNGTAVTSVTGGSTTVYPTVITSTYAVQTSAAVAYTSGGSVYTSYTPTSYMTTATLSSTVTSVSGGTTATGAAGGAAASSSSTAQSGAAATGAPGSFFAAGAVVLGALAMI